MTRRTRYRVILTVLQLSASRRQALLAPEGSGGVRFPRPMTPPQHSFHRCPPAKFRPVMFPGFGPASGLAMVFFRTLQRLRSILTVRNGEHLFERLHRHSQQLSNADRRDFSPLRCFIRSSAAEPKVRRPCFWDRHGFTFRHGIPLNGVFPPLIWHSSNVNSIDNSGHTPLFVVIYSYG
jgi:hypothetical protein